MLVDQGVLRRKGDAWTVVEDEVIAVPDTVQAIIASRIDRLPTDRKVLLQDAAVVGKVFWAGAVAAMAGASDEAVSEGLRDLARRDLIRPARRSSIAGQTEYAFRHMLVRDVAYGQIPRGSRAARHLGAADWIEAMAGGRVADQAELLVHHCERALESVRATGSPTEIAELERRTGRFLVLAGDRARQLDAERSFDSYLRALELFAVDDPDRPAVLVEAAGVGTRSRAISERGRAARRGPAGRGGGRPEGRRGADPRRAGRRLLERRRHGAGASPDGASDGGRPVGIADAGDRQGIPPDRRHAHDRSRPGPRGSGVVRSGAADGRAVRSPQGVPHGAAHPRHRSLHSGGPGGIGRPPRVAPGVPRRRLLREAVLVSANAGWWTLQVEGPAPGLELQDQAAELGDRVGQVQTAMWSRAESTAPLYDLGEWDEVIRRADVVARWDRDTGGTQMLTIVLPQKARVLLLRGQAEAAHSLEVEFLATARAIRDPQVYVPALAAAATIDAARGDLVTAVRLVDELDLVLADRAPPGPRHVLDCLRVLIQSGSMDRARAFLARERETWGPYEVWFVSGEAALAEAAGDPESAVGLFRDAAAGWDRIGNRVERAHALFGAGRCLVASERAAEGDEALAEARATFAGLGAAVLVAAIDAATGSPAQASGSAGG